MQNRSLIRAFVRGLLVASVIGAFGSVDSAEAQVMGSSQYYSGANDYPVAGYPLYPSPRSYVPPVVGHTYITYPPFNPHNMLYRHKLRIQGPNGHARIRYH